LVLGLRSAAAQQSPAFVQIFGFQEQLGKSRVCLVCTSRIESYFQITGDLQNACPIPVVGQLDSPNLCFRVGDDRDLVTGLELSVAAPDRDAVRSQFGLILVGDAACRLAARGPKTAVMQVTNVAVLAPTIASRILAPARHVHPVNSAITATRRRQEYTITVVG
jgi:hypothetical protein